MLLTPARGAFPINARYPVLSDRWKDQGYGVGVRDVGVRPWSKQSCRIYGLFERR